ncbi:MAG: hypothetical protein QOE85_608, partial [Actinomycetota bacterium]|nr:hypothetical protein [Actinomycetota bacterium]
MAIDVSPREVLRLRLRTQRIEGAASTATASAATASATVADTVRHLLATQAQDFAQSLWAVGLRTPGATRSDVLAALESGEVVRTLPMRGTLHLVPAEDLRWMLGLTSARMLRAASTRFRDLGLDQATLDSAEKLVARELAGGGSATRDEFMKLLERHGISAEGQRGYHVIFFLCQRQLICWGPPRGTQQALVLVDEWISKSREPDRDESLREFALRYFAGHGPATVRDLAWWTKLTLADARAATAAASGELTELTLDGVSYWIATSELDAATSGSTASGSTAAVHALPGFDEYLLGYQDRSLALAEENSSR